MKKMITYFAFASIIILTSCGPSKEDQAKTCECEALFTKMKDLEGEYMLSERISSADAEKKAIDENKDAYDKCIQLHKNLGEDAYLKATQKCDPK